MSEYEGKYLHLRQPHSEEIVAAAKAEHGRLEALAADLDVQLAKLTRERAAVEEQLATQRALLT